MKEKIIETSHLTKQFGDLTAVDGINIYVNKGELVGFLGPNGAGKTTTISMLSTSLKPTSGDAFIEGQSIIKDPQEVRKRIGLVPQELIFYEYLTAKENVEFFAGMYNLPKEKISQQTDKLFTRVGLQDKMTARSSTLSSGMKRRLNLIMGLVMDTDILFLDEPSAGLDPQAARMTWDFIRELRDQGKTVILTTHNMHEAEELSDRIYIIDHGKIIAEGSPQALRANVGEGEIFDLKFKENLDLQKVKQQIEALGSHITSVHILSADRIVITATGGVQHLQEMEDILPNKLQSLENLNIHGPTLEDVFLILTGRALRE
ncbi:MAG: ABC transporter ATP-binding protein [Candidatus Heimdallarchaeota archaeon]